MLNGRLAPRLALPRGEAVEAGGAEHHLPAPGDLQLRRALPERLRVPPALARLPAEQQHDGVARGPARAAQHLGSGRVAASGVEAPNTSAIPVRSG